MNKSRDDAFNKAIESAVERGTNKPGQGQSGMSERHEKVDQALRQRLQQLRTAMGDEARPAETPAPESSPPFVPIPMPTLDSPPAQPRAENSNRLVLWLFSALVLGGAAWYVLNQGPANAITAANPVKPAEATPPVTPGPLQAVVEPLKATAAAPTEAALPTTAAPAPSPAQQPVDGPAQVVSTAVAVAAPTASPAPTAPPPVASSEQLGNMVESWRQAWSNRDTESYLSFYGSAFEPGKGQSLSQWKASRYRNVGGKTDIKVQINDLKVATIDDRQVRITFLQDYASGNYKESAQPKTLIVAREGDAWRIVKEWQGDASY